MDVRVSVEGLDRDLKANVLAYLSVEQEKDRESLTSSRLRLLHNRAEGEIRKALQPYGYFKPRIDGRLKQDGDEYELTYEVEPGPQVRLKKVDFEIQGEGRDDPKYNPTFPMTQGNVLDQTLYEKAKKDLLSATVEWGYLNARYVRHEVLVDLQSYTASIELHLDTGPRYFFGEVRFLQDVMKPEFLARYLSFQAGDPYSFEKLLTLQSNLIDSEYFKSVEVEAQRDQAENKRVPIDIHLKPNKRDRYRVGLGYSTDTGPRLTLDWKRRRVGPSGHRMQSELRLSKPHSTFQVEYLTPLQRPTKDSRTYGFSADRYDTDSRKGVLAQVYGRQSIGLGKGWRRTLGLDYSYESYEVGDQEDIAFLLVPNVQWTKLKTDKRNFLQRGHKLDFRIEGAHDKLFSATSYLQFSTHDKFIVGINDDWRLLARTDLGATFTDDLLELPASKRFFAGGDNSVRGFDLDRLGPTDEEGEVIGGRYLAVGSLEVERIIAGKWSAALFIDAGNAFDPDYESEVEYGAGFGIRWRSPVGPIRIDFASGISADETQLRLHLVVGPEL
ncbi:MAG: autotransporter assembly complex family protein [Gammaproteobacteria bacterium]|nr:autotransporter assembly complex family protein [Gammaproteobacteria bacterium]